MGIWKRRLCIATAASLIGLAGCQTRPTVPPDGADCAAQLAYVQGAIQQHDAHNARYQPVPGFPTYRTTRFWSSFADQPLTAAQTRHWRQQLHQLGMTTLTQEWQTLPSETRQTVAIDAFTATCTEALFEASLNQDLTADALAVPDAYSDWQRFWGFYALIKHAAAGSIAEYQADMRQRITGFEALPAPVSHYAPPSQATTAESTHTWLTNAYQQNPLGVPQLTPEQTRALLAYHAPHIAVAHNGPADALGAARWQANATGPQRHIDPAQPTLYTEMSYIRWQEQVLLQLNYTLWFPERPKPTPSDWYGGPLDGLVWRVTLHQDGSVLFYDSIHPCGCYHSVHLPQGSPLAPTVLTSTEGDHSSYPSDPSGKPSEALEPILFFAAPFTAHTAQPTLHLEADTHYLVQVDTAAPDTAPGTRQPYALAPYALAPYDTLHRLPLGDGFKNWFDEDGLIEASSRRERYFLWPLGVPNAGAMRQAGHHAIAFVGKRHFDEASVEQLLDLTDAP